MADNGYFTTVGEITPRLAEDAHTAVQKQCKKLAEVIGRDTVAVILASLRTHFIAASGRPIEPNQEIVQMEFTDDVS